MRRLSCVVAAILALAIGLLGCEREPFDVKKDAMDPESLKAVENPPPGVPGAVSKGGTPPRVPAGGR